MNCRRCVVCCALINYCCDLYGDTAVAVVVVVVKKSNVSACRLKVHQVGMLGKWGLCFLKLSHILPCIHARHCDALPVARGKTVTPVYLALD